MMHRCYSESRRSSYGNLHRMDRVDLEPRYRLYENQPGVCELLRGKDGAADAGQICENSGTLNRTTQSAVNGLATVASGGMARNATRRQKTDKVRAFLKRRRAAGRRPLTAISLFSDCGLSDIGYRQAGFELVAQVEREKNRAEIGAANFSNSRWYVDNVELVLDAVVDGFHESHHALDLLVATPPCQGMSSSNPSRGKRGTNASKRHAEKNKLVLEVIPYVDSLRPRVAIIENVRQLLTHTVQLNGQQLSLPDLLAAQLNGYTIFSGVVNVADYGVPQGSTASDYRRGTKRRNLARGHRGRQPIAVASPNARRRVEQRKVAMGHDSTMASRHGIRKPRFLIVGRSSGSGPASFRSSLRRRTLLSGEQHSTQLRPKCLRERQVPQLPAQGNSRLAC